jgi:L-rhamnose mutarotase
MEIKYLTLLCFGLLLMGCSQFEPGVRRFGQVAQVRPEKLEMYKQLHAAVWPEVVQGLEKYNIRNYSIFLKDLEEVKPYLFAYFEYTGKDFDGDMAKMMENPKVREWENLAGGECLFDQSPEGKGIWWADMEEVFYFDGQTEREVDNEKVQRFGSVIGVHERVLDSYKLIHKHAWPEVLGAIKKGNIRNYPIYLHKIEGKYYLFGYFEYVGDNFDADMASIDNEPATKAWIKFTDEVCQIPIPTRAEGEWWANMEQVFYQE